MSIYCAGITPALKYAAQELLKAGIPIADSPHWDTKHLLLDVPSFRPGSNPNIDTLLASLPRDITVWGGNLNYPTLKEYHCVDLLKDESYLLENAIITADCTLVIINPLQKNPWSETNVLIIGNGRIGKSLAPKLANAGCCVTIASRKSGESWQYPLITLGRAKKMLCEFDIIINTAPIAVLSEEDLAGCKHCLKIDLASVKGIAGEDVIWARGLPGRYAPERSGALIARTILRIMKEGLQ